MTPSAWGTRPAATPNQIVAYNLKAARELRGWTQPEAAQHLEPYLGWRWTTSSFSDAERSFDGSFDPERRSRAFDADDIAAFSLAFDLPVEWFLLPPPPQGDEPYTVLGGPIHRKGEDELYYPYEMDSAEFAQRTHAPARFDPTGPYEQRVSQVLGKSAALSQVTRLVGQADEQLLTTLQSHIASLREALEALTRLERQLNPPPPAAPANPRRKRGRP